MDIKVNEDFTTTENEKEYKKVTNRLKQLIKDRNKRVFLSFVAGISCAAIPPIGFAILSSVTGITPMMSLSPLAVGAGFGAAVTVAGVTSTILFDGREIRELKRKSLELDPDKKLEEEKELEEKVFENNSEFEKIKEENNKFLIFKKEELEKSLKEQNLEQPKNTFNPKNEVDKDKTLEEKTPEEIKRERIMEILSEGHVSSTTNEEEKGKQR